MGHKQHSDDELRPPPYEPIGYGCLVASIVSGHLAPVAAAAAGLGAAIALSCAKAVVARIHPAAVRWLCAMAWGAAFGSLAIGFMSPIGAAVAALAAATGGLILHRIQNLHEDGSDPA